MDDTTSNTTTDLDLHRVAVNKIIVSDRFREDMGDIAALAKSISDVGLLQPIVITGDYRLVAGGRRLAAVKELKWDAVPIRVVTGLDDMLKLLRAERDENTCRKDFTPTEAVNIGRRLEELEREEAKQRQQASRAKKGTKVGEPQGAGNFPPPSDNGRVRDKVAEAVGMSGRTYEKAKAVVEAAEQEPEQFAEVAEEMNKTKKVDPAYQKVKGKRRGSLNKKIGLEARARHEKIHGRDPAKWEREWWADTIVERLDECTDEDRHHSFQGVFDALLDLIAGDKLPVFKKVNGNAMRPPTLLDLVSCAVSRLSVEDREKWRRQQLASDYDKVRLLIKELDEWGHMHEARQSPVAMRMIAAKLKKIFGK